MTTLELERYLADFLNFENFRDDISQNGVQVANDNCTVKRIGFAVDACAETIYRASLAKCDVLAVHHGLFWGKSQPIVGVHYERIKMLMQNNIALFAAHLPLDAHEQVGNNYGIAKRLELVDLEPFYKYHGMSIGVMGKLPVPLSIDKIARKLFPDGETPTAIIPSSKNEISSICIVSGGGDDAIFGTVEKKADLLITGDFNHQFYHTALEYNKAVIAGGHYNTETVGVNLLLRHVEKELGIECVFIDVPTGL